MSSSLILDSTFAVPAAGNGTVRLRLVNAGRTTFSGFRVVFSAIVPLTPVAGSPSQLLGRLGTSHEIGLPEGTVLLPGGVVEMGRFDCAYQLVHANDGPVQAYLVTDEGRTVPVRAAPTERTIIGVGADAPRHTLVLDQPSDVTGSAWAVAAECEARLHPDEASLLTTSGRGDTVTATVEPQLGAEEFRLEVADHAGASGWHVAAGSVVAMQWGFMDLARRLRDGVVTGAENGRAFTPRHRFRGLMIDVARHFYPAVDIDHVIDLAAWRRLNAVHLHLADDQAWRLPTDTYPALTEVAAWRGHDLPVPAQNGSGPDAYGGWYTADDVARWRAAARRMGIQLIPEIDVPGHSFAAIAALPELRDPGDSGDARSVQNFPYNVLNPGVPATWAFLETVFGEVGDLFPDSPIHIGCDEVPTGAWKSSPAAQAWAVGQGLGDHRQVEAAFVREIVRTVRRSTGRRIGAWQEAAECGGMQPDDGYVIGWKSAGACHRLADAGYEVVAAPGSAYYLDMATGPDWRLPGMWWAGYVTSESIAQFDVTDGWEESARRRLIGIEACLWGEHVPDRATLRAMLLPRLDAFGDAGWNVRSVG